MRFKFSNSDVVDSNHHISFHGVSKKKCCLRHVLSRPTLSRRWLEVRKHRSPFHKARRMAYFVPFASADDGVAVNGTSQASSSNSMEEMRAKLNEALQGKSISNGLVQSIHDAARAIELAIQQHSSSSKTSWFSKAWLGVDKNAWVKTLSYQVGILWELFHLFPCTLVIVLLELLLSFTSPS